jgi:hypothetical protein
MGDTPGKGTERLDTTPPLPFLEDPEPKEPTPPAPVEAGAEEEEEWEAPSQDEWQLHQDRLAAAEEAAKDARGQVEQSNTLMREMLGRQAPPPDPEPEEPGPMPDPARDPDDFGLWLGKRDKFAEHKFTKQLRAVQAEHQFNDRANALFSEFVAKYPKMADKRDVVELASRRAGLRPTDPKEQIFEKVLDQLTVMGFTVEDQPPGDPPPKVRAGGGRTSGLGGGSGQRRRRRAEPEEKATDLVDQMAAEQVRMGVM